MIIYLVLRFIKGVLFRIPFCKFFTPSLLIREGVFFMVNIFLTGPINIGKSTIINKVVAELQAAGVDTAGFYTLPYVINGELRGFYIEPLNYPYFVPKKKERLIAYGIGDKWYAVKETFDKFGADILDYCLNSTADLIIMDELGFFESEAFRFQEMVFTLLSSPKLVFGVIKPIIIPFMDKIRGHKDVILFEITDTNRDRLPNKILKIIKTEMGI